MGSESERGSQNNTGGDKMTVFSVSLTKRSVRMLKKLCEEWFVIRGEEPWPLSKAVNHLIEKEYTNFIFRKIKEDEVKSD
jgi:hypothetical protein